MNNTTGEKKCTWCGEVPQDGWYSKSGYCKKCAEEVLRNRKQTSPIFKRPWFIVAVVFVVILGALAIGSGGNGAPDADTANMNLQSGQMPLSREDKIFAIVDRLQAASTAQDSFAVNASYDSSAEEIVVLISDDEYTPELMAVGYLSESAREKWDTLKSSLGSLSQTAVDSLADDGISDVDVVVHLLGSSGLESPLVIFRNGDLEFDIYEAVDTIAPTLTAAQPDTITIGQKNACQQAESYLSIMPFSYNGLIEQLEYEGFSNQEATYAADNCGADWNEQAAKQAKSYLEIMSFSRKSLIEQLEYEGFTAEQAGYGARENGY